MYILTQVVFRLLRFLPFFEGVRDLAEWIIPQTRNRRRAEGETLERLRREVSAAVKRPLVGASSSKVVLFVGQGNVSDAYLETFFRKSFELAGYRPVVLIPRNRIVRRAYSALGQTDLCSLDRYRPIIGNTFRKPLAGLMTIAELLAFEHTGIRCGQYAASTLMRVTRSGRLDFADATVRAAANRALADSLDYAAAAHRLLEDIRPDAAVFVDRGYSPAGELFDACLKRGIPAYTWNAAHRNNAVLLKRYTMANADVHPSSLSADSWRALRAMPWMEEHWRKVRDELYGCYTSGEWYGEVGTQVNKSLLGRGELARRLALDPAKKTAVIFPHILWDATFFWGEDLFGDYESWFIAALEAACRNDALNWVIKIHPANLVKDVRDGFSGEHSEIATIRRHVGNLPPHVRLLAADTDISTLSLYQAMDYCLTVRGTVGIEAACFGVRVLTAGTGRYDRLGFTSDFDSRESYLAALANLHRYPAMTEEEIELARRYAYGTFLCRPTQLESFKLKYRQTARAELETGINEALGQSLREASDLQRIGGWIGSGTDDFFLAPTA